jgi:hypothetical protein
MNFQQLAQELNEESKGLLENSDPAVLHAIKASTAAVFAKYMPGAPHIKQTTRVRLLDYNALATPLHCFFPAYSGMEVKREIIEIGEAACSMLVKLTTAHGPFWVNAQTSVDGVSLELID